MLDCYAIIGMQYGSEAKGALSGFLAYHHAPETFMANWSPNAGHTYIGDDGKIVRRCIPIGAYVSPAAKVVLLGPGSIIDPQILRQELDDLHIDITVVVHPNAAVLGSSHARQEEGSEPLAAIGSTQKGTSIAAIDRMRRYQDSPYVAKGSTINQDSCFDRVIVSDAAYHDYLTMARVVQVEGCQGHSLSMYNGFYPYTTSRDTSIHQLKADIAWHDAHPLQVYGCIRTFPIRVAGTSGPCYRDQREHSWEAMGVMPEITTVTKKVRRVFTFSPTQIHEAMRINEVHHTYLSGCDYLDEDDATLSRIKNLIHEIVCRPPRWESYGPHHNDMVTYGEV